jgi:hypothetical protein
MSTPSITGLDGVTRPWDEVFEQGYVPGLGEATRRGYVVRRTYFDRERPHEDVAEFPVGRYGDACERVSGVRLATEQGYGVIDSVHEAPDGRLVRLAG